MENEIYSNGIGYLIIAIVVLIFIWLLLRELILWYYKINKIVELQETQVRLLRTIEFNTRVNEDTPSIIDEPEAPPEPNEETIKNIEENLTEAHLAIIEERKHKVLEGQALILHIKTNEIKIVSSEEYDDIEDLDMYKILYEK